MKYILLFGFFTNCTSISVVSTSEDVEKRIKVAVIDTGVLDSMANQPYMCKNGVVNFTTDKTQDTRGHGSNIVGIISKGINSKTHCIVSIKFYIDEKSYVDNTKAYHKALEYVNSDKSFKYLNLSIGGSEIDTYEKTLIMKYANTGGIIVAAAGNEGRNLDGFYCYYPACYKKEFKKSNFHVVKSVLDSSNYGFIVTDAASGKDINPGIWGVPTLSGTSQATAQIMAEILKRGSIQWRKHD